MSSKWHRRFMERAVTVSGWSKDPKRGVGAVITDKDNREVSCGFNGFPKGVDDNNSKLTDSKQELILHAEVNAILYAKTDLTGCSIYISTPPCPRCASIIVQAGIKKVFVVAIREDSKWTRAAELSKELLKQAGVEYCVLWRIDV